MKNWQRSGAVLFGTLAVVNLFAACGGSDDEEPVGDGDAGGESGRSNIECVAADGVSDAVCVNDDDCPFVEDGTFRQTAKDCLLSACLGNADQAGCTADCLVDELGASAECSACYGISGSCSADNCLEECAREGDAPECVECQAENGCTQEFFECSGLALPE